MGKKLALGCAAALACAMADSRYNIETTRCALRFPALPAQFDGFRVVQLSDLHSARFGRENARLVRRVRELSPDLIVFTGDMSGVAGELGAVEELLRGLRGVAPVYGVNGNHERRGGASGTLAQIMESYGARCLVNEYECVERQGARIVVCGADDPDSAGASLSPPALARRLRQEHPVTFVLWLAHRNNYVELYRTLPVELILCGHAHGGVVRLPGIGGLLNTKRRFLAEYEQGLYYGERFTMAVSRGLGGSFPIPRLFNRPELICVELLS